MVVTLDVKTVVPKDVGKVGKMDATMVAWMAVRMEERLAV